MGCIHHTCLKPGSILDDIDMKIAMNTLRQSRIGNQHYLKIADERTLKENFMLAKSIYIKFYNLCDASVENHMKKPSILLHEG